jgi:beta-N-acetylglucosaminidase
MKSGYKCSAKRIAAIGVMLCMLVLTCLTVTSVLNTKAEESIGQGHVNYDVTDLRIRKSPVSGSVITKVDGGFKFDIYEEVDTSSGLWYGIGFYLNGDYYRGYVTSEYVTVDKRNDYKPDADFEEYLDSQGFPDSYKDGLRQLHAQYPNWVFVADHNGKDWSDVLENQNVIGRSLTYGSAKSSWKSVADGCYDWESGQYTQLDSGGWVQASSALVEYALDPRNFLNADNIFMFENLSFDSSLQDESGLESMVDGTFMENSSHDLRYDGRNYTYITGLLLAGQESGVSPYHLASRILQEQGNSGYGSSISGTQSGYYWGYYNYYNIGAYASGGLTAVQNGLKYASRNDDETLRPWNTRMKSIIGGAIYLGKSYINRGQNTLYYEKFDMTGRGHQYMTNVLAPRSESVKSAQGYSDSNKNNIAFIFRIPVYENMPENVCEIPTGDGSPNNRLSDLYVEGYSLTPTFSLYTIEYSLIVDYDTSSVYVGGSALDSSADVSGLGYHDLSVGSNDITITVTAANGDNQDYTITVVRQDKEPDPTPEPDPEPTPDPEPDVAYPGFSTTLSVDEDEKYISGLTVSDYVQDVLDKIDNYNGAYSKILNKNGNEKDGLVSTGDILITYNSSGEEVSRYEIVIYGDVNGDGEIDLFDFAQIKRSILGIADPSGVYWKAADCNRDGELDLFDFAKVKRYILGIGSINQ